MYRSLKVEKANGMLRYSLSGEVVSCMFFIYSASLELFFQSFMYREDCPLSSECGRADVVAVSNGSFKNASIQTLVTDYFELKKSGSLTSFSRRSFVSVLSGVKESVCKLVRKQSLIPDFFCNVKIGHAFVCHCTSVNAILSNDSKTVRKPSRASVQSFVD